MSLTRRNLLKKTLAGTAAASIPFSALKFLSPAEAKEAVEQSKTRYAFLVDTTKCVGCGFCVKACKIENDVPWESPVTRTWVERYVITKDGKSHIDSPEGARDGFTEQKFENEGHNSKDIDPKDIDKAFFVPKLCNQCENPACVQVCPVGATYSIPEGVVLVDRSWCIGCGYCIMACPYGVRYFHPVYKVADKCTFCYHRLKDGRKTACVDACPFEARQVCDLKNPDDPVTKTILTQRVAILKDEYGTKPHVFYIGLDRTVR
jgi:Fe-S-cluster-containing dehydrogenase component